MNKKSGIILGIFALLILLSFYFDFEISRGIASIRSNLLNDFFLGITFISSEIIILTARRLVIISRIGLQINQFDFVNIGNNGSGSISVNWRNLA